MKHLSSGVWKWAVPALVIVAVVLGVVVQQRRQRERMQYRLLSMLPDDTASDPALVAFATQEAKPVYSQHCAVCHGPDLHGRPDIGAPNLTDGVWIYGKGRVYDIERTLLYGIRSGHSKTHNITDMPGFGLAGTLTPDEIRSVVQYVMKLSGRPYQVEAANEGEALYLNAEKGGCGDCHGPGARGDPDYGSADLTANVWNSGSTEQDVYNAIYFGEHRVMPAWIGVLSLQDIRALSLYLCSVSHSLPANQPETRASRAQEE